MRSDDQEQRDLDRAFARAGFRVVCLGMGCDGYRRDDGDRTLIVADDGARPESFDAPALLGVYITSEMEDGAGPIEVEDFESARALLARFI